MIMRDTYIVLGMHRSGTSLTAALLHHAGVEMMHGLPVVTNRESPIGYYEDKRIMNLNDKILKLAGGTWKQPPSHESIRETIPKVSESVKAIVEEFNGKYPKWGMKDPRLCLTCEVFLPYLENPKFVVVLRDPEANFKGFQAVRFSHLHQKYRTREYFFGVYERYLENIESYVVDYDTMVVMYEDYFTDNDNIEKLIEFTNSTASVENLSSLINAKFKHH